MRRLMRAKFVPWSLIAAVFLLSAGARVEADIPVDRISGGITGYDMPYYFSGTNSRVYVTVGMTYDCIKRVEVLIGDELAWYRDYPSPEVFPYVWTIALTQFGIMFDSTHFPSGSLEVKVKVWGWGPSYRVFTEEAPVTNRVALFGRYDLDIYPLFHNGSYSFGSDSCIGLPTAADAYETIGYTEAYRVTSLGWDKFDLLACLADSTAFYIHTHGGSDHFWTDNNDYHYSYPEDPSIPPEMAFSETVPAGYQHGFALKSTRVTAMGSGLPPLNSTALPPITFVFLDTCETAQNNYFDNAFLYPYTNCYSNPMTENQALLGYNITKESPQTLAVNEAIFSALMDGYTIQKARDDAFDAYDGSNKPSSSTDLMHIWGDFYTRIKGVYTGNATPSQQTSWYRSL